MEDLFNIKLPCYGQSIRQQVLPGAKKDQFRLGGSSSPSHTPPSPLPQHYTPLPWLLLVLPVIFTYYWSCKSLWLCCRYHDLGDSPGGEGLQRTTSPCPTALLQRSPPHHPPRVLCPMGCGAWGSPQPSLTLHRFQLGVLTPAEPMSPKETALIRARRLAHELGGLGLPRVPLCSTS